MLANHGICDDHPGAPTACVMSSTHVGVISSTTARALLTVCAVFGTMTTVPSKSPKDWQTSITCKGFSMQHQ